MSDNCSGKICYKQHRVNNNKFYLASIILALLPKCPFCIMAYTSTMIMCSNYNTNQTTHISYLTVAITAFFCSLVLLGIFLNHRGQWTKYAFLLAILGTLTIMYSVMQSGGEVLYYVGTFILFLSIWLNGSFYWFIGKLKKNNHTAHRQLWQ